MTLEMVMQQFRKVHMEKGLVEANKVLQNYLKSDVKTIENSVKKSIFITGFP